MDNNDTYEELPHQQTCSRQLRNLIVRCKIMPSALARAIGVTPPTITRFLAGTSSISMDVADRIFEVLNITLVVSVPLPDLSKHEKPRGRPKKKDPDGDPDIYKHGL